MAYFSVCSQLRIVFQQEDIKSVVIERRERGVEAEKPGP
jgi:hypothetical protein